MSQTSMFHGLGLHWLGGRWAATGLDAIVPPQCVLCHGGLSMDADDASRSPASNEEGVLLCGSCRRELTSDVPRCGGCGEREGTASPCEGCRRVRHGCAGLAVLGGYGDRLRSAILRCKRPGGEPLVAALAGLLVSRHRKTLEAWGIDLVVPVPMHWSRRMLRGTSAADELAAMIAGRMGIPCHASLRRTVATRMQNELPVAERRGNVATAFRTRGRVSSKTILVVDDVSTTGSTLAACSGCLTAAGASAVYAAVVAKADRSSDDGDD